MTCGYTTERFNCPIQAWPSIVSRKFKPFIWCQDHLQLNLKSFKWLKHHHGRCNHTNDCYQSVPIAVKCPDLEWIQQLVYFICQYLPQWC